MLGEAVRDGLRQESYVVDWVQDGGAALAALSTADFSALVLDLGLPRSDGLGVLRWLRQNGQTTPVIIVTARDRVTDRIAGLDAGADDYLIKPFDIDELAARLRAMRRAEGVCRVHTHRRRGGARAAPASGHLPGRAGGIDRARVRGGRAADAQGGLPRDAHSEIEEELYGFEDDIASNAIEVHIHNLRRKLGPHFIANVKGRGYRVDNTR